MGEPYLAEIRIISFNFAPKGWALCNGQFLPINQNQALFSILGTMYGGNGQTTFQLPDFRGRTGIGAGGSHVVGERAGEELHTLIQSEMPAHTHSVGVTSNNASSGNPVNNLPARIATLAYTQTIASLTTAAPESITSAGGSQPHENRQPFLVLNFVIALQGIFPSRN